MPFTATGFLALLVDVQLPNNLLSGALPSSIGLLQQLRNLDVSNNHLSRTIPLSMGLMRSLVTLCLSQNRLTGSIPSALSTAASLTWIDVSSNSLSGCIAAALGKIPYNVLDLSNNLFTGVVPNTLCDHYSPWCYWCASRLYLSSNQFTCYSSCLSSAMSSTSFGDLTPC